MRHSFLTLLCTSFLLATGVTACGGTDGTFGNGSSDKKNESPKSTVESEPSPTDPEDKPKPNGSGTDVDQPSETGEDLDVTTPTAGTDGTILVPQVVGTSASSELILSQAHRTKALDTYDLSCPAVLSSTDVPYVYVELKNTGTARALTSVWISSLASGPANTSDVMTVYASLPKTEAERKSCLGGISYSCSAAPCPGTWPGFSSGAGESVEVPAQGSVFVFVQGEKTKTGSFALNVKTDYLK